MAEKLALICAVLILYGCTSTESTGTGSGSSPIPSNFLITSPSRGALTIIGVSGPLQRREAEIDAAREDAARKAAMYHGIKARYESIQSVGGGINDYQAGSNLILEYDDQLEPYLDKLSFNPNRDMIVRDRTVYIRFSYPAVFPGNINYAFRRNPDGSPEWTTRPPQNISGFPVGVGFASRQFRRQDTFTKSTESAVAGVVSQMATNVSVTGTADGGRSGSGINMQSMGNLNNFLVLEIWIDPVTEAVWTLAIAQTTD